MRARTAALLGALVLLPAGCGSSASAPAGSPAAGREAFARECAFCHSLSGHSSARQQGGDLLGARLRRPVLYQFTAEMPVRHHLSRSELAAVVDYILAVQRRGR